MPRPDGFDELWVYATDRLGRRLADMATTGQRLMEQLGIVIWSVTQGRMEPFIFDITAAMAQQELRTMRRRFGDSINRIAGEGGYPGGVVAYGYRVDGTRPHARIVPDDTVVWGDWTAADVVRHVYRRVGIDGWSSRRAAEELNALGVPPHSRLEGVGRRRRGSGCWREGVIRRMLAEPKYRGEHAYGRMSAGPRELVPVPVEPLVDPALWVAAQETRARNRIMARNTARVYLLRSVMRCTTCGTTYVGSTESHRRGAVWYRCGGQRNERGRFDGRCPGKGIRGDLLEPLVWEDIERWLRQPGDLLEELSEARGRDSERIKRMKQRTTVERALASLVEQETRIADGYVRGTLKPALLAAQQQRVEAERTSLQAQLAEIERADAEPTAIDPDLVSLLRERLDAGLTPDERAEIVRLLVPRIDITTTLDAHGSKHAKATIRYAFPIAVVRALTRMGSSRR